MAATPDDQTRARDMDRVSVLARLDDALMDGQLDHEEHGRRSVAAREAVTLCDLRALTADLQHGDLSPVREVQRPFWRRRRIVVGTAVVAVSAVVGVGVVAAVTGDEAPVARTSVAAPADPMIAGDMFTASGIRDVVAAVRARFHTTTVEGIHLYRDHAVLFVFDSASPVGHTYYDYSPGGEFYSPEYYSGLAVSTSDAPVDLARIDPDKVAALIASAPGRLGLVGPNAPRASQFRVTVGGDEGGEIWMGVNDLGVDSHLVAHLNGAIKGVERCGWGC